MPPPIDLPSLPNLPSPGNLIAPVAGIAGDAADWVGDKVGSAGQKAKDMAAKIADVTGLGGIGGKIEESVDKIRSFATEQVDALLNGAVSAARATEEFARETLDGARTKIDSTVDQALDRAKEVVKEIEDVPSRASEILDDARRIKERALERRESLRQHKQRFRERKAKIPKVVTKHLEEIFAELDEELDAEAVEAEKLGVKVEQDSARLYNKTVEDAKHYGGLLVKQSEQNYRRGKKLKEDLQKDKKSIGTWAKDHVNRVKAFNRDRALAAKKIRDPGAAKSWATESIEGAHQLAKEIKDDVGKKPGEIKSLGQRRVDEAMELAQGVKQEVKTAADWARTQKGSNAAWKRAMRETQNAAESFLHAQGARVAMRISAHGEAIGAVARNLGEEQLEDTGRELGKSVDDVKKSYKEVQGSIHGEGEEVAEDLEHQAALHPETTASEASHKLNLGFGLEMDAEDVAGGTEADPRQLEQPATKKRSEPLESKPTTKTGVEKEQKANGPAKIESQPESNKQGREGKQIDQTSAPSKGPVKPEKPASNVGKDETVAEKSTSRSEGAFSFAPLSNISQPGPPAGPVPIPYPNTGLVDRKTAKGESIQPIQPQKKEAQKKVAKQDSSKPPAEPASSKPEKPSSVTPVERKKPDEPYHAGGKGPPGEIAPKAPTEAKPWEKDKSAGIESASNKAGRGQAIQRKESGRQQVQDPRMFLQSLVSMGGTGSAPDESTRKQIAPHVGFDPSVVRFHIGPTAQAAAAALSADAFTIGSDIFFGAGKFDPTSPKGLGLIGHEATHVGQQLGLRGNKLQFDTKSGGDAMEQEAQEVGERIAANVTVANSLRVGRYIRTYEPADDEPITSALSMRLDSLSLLALRSAGRLLSLLGPVPSVRLDEVLVSLDIEIERMSDTEIVDAWAEAIASAIEAAHPVGAHQLELAGAPSPSTHVVQRKLGDSTNEPPKPQAKELDPAMLAKLAAINPSGKEKDMIRQLALRAEVDPQIEAIERAKSSPGQYLPKNPTSSPFPQPQMPHQAFTPDERALNDRLQKEGVPSWQAFQQLKKDFVSAFQAKGFNVTKYILAENLEVVRKQIPRYLSKDAKNPDAQINKLKKSAKAVLEAMEPYMALIREVFGSVVSVGPANLDTIDELLLRQTASGDLRCTDDQAKRLTAARNKWISVRQQHGNEHVVLLGRDYDPNKIIGAKDDADLEMTMLKDFQQVEKNIIELQKSITVDKFWELHPMVSMTKKQMGVRPGEGADKTVQEAAQGKANDAMLWGLFQAAVSIALAVTAMVATGGLAAVAMIGSAGLSVYSAAKAMDEYAFKSAAANSALDQAKLLSKEDPSLFWLAFELIAAGLDLGAAAGAFGKLASIAAKARAAKGEAAALEELDKVARAAYKETKGLAMSEDDFVKRLLDSAKKAVPDAETFAKQAKLVTELLEATSPRAIAILKGDPAAIKGLIMEYGNWKGMMGALKNGGDDAAKMSKNIAAYRQEIIDKFKARGASPLDNASTEAVSDFDLNVVPKDGEGAGKRLLEFEKEMRDSFGPQWSEALLMNFYTDKSQLMAVDEALKLAKGTPEHAKILQRVTEKSEKLNFAKMLEHAGDSPAARQQVLELMQKAGVKYSLEELDGVIKGLKGADKEASRAAKLLEVDKLQKELAALPANSPERAAKLEKITEVQMEANFLTKEAYIGPAAVKGGALSNAEAYQNALSQLEMIGHVISENGGDILKASREYELYKYINRYTAAAKKAGVETPRGTFFENYSNYIYKRAREGMSETAHVPGASVADEAADQAVDGKYLLDMYNEFRNEVKETLPKIKKAAETKGGSGWMPEGGKTPTPAAGAPPAPKPAGDPVTIKDYTKPGAALEPSKVAQLPAASAKAKDAADKMSKEKAKGKVDSLVAVTSAGFSHSKSAEGIGMFKTRIPGVDKEVIVTILPAEEEARFNQQLAAAIAAASTGVGPKVHGKVDVGPKKLGFAMDSVEGGIADSFNSKDPGAANANKAEMLKNAKNIGPATFVDVETYKDSIWDKGIRYTGPVDGFVTPDGHWRPVNFSNTKPIEVDERIVNYREMHDYYFNTLKSELMASHLASRKP